MYLACGQDDGRVQGSHGGGVLQERTARGAERQCEDKQEGEPTGRHPDLVSCFTLYLLAQDSWGEGGRAVLKTTICSS